jgi:hypothetical protein
LNARMQFLEVMRFNTNVQPLKWEYAYWGETLNRWYREGLPKKKFVSYSDKITTPTASLYLTAFRSNIGKLENGIIPPGQGVFGGGVYWPTQGMPKEKDAESYFDLDPGIILLDVNQLYYPMYEIKVLEEDETIFKYIDIDGITRIYQKEEATIPSALEWKVKDWDSWNRIKAERLSLKNILGRFPDNWDTLVEEYKNRNYPLTLGGYPHGFFGTLAHIMGYENLFIAYYDAPELVKDILDTFTNLWIQIWEEVLAKVDVDMAQIFEDVSMGTGSMISPDIFREFMLPYYQRITSFLKSRGVDIILVDTDGDCNELIPLFLEGGVTGLYPMEASSGMDILATRKKYPGLQIMGGVSKYDIAGGKDSIDRALAIIEQVIKTGGYIPYIDHSVPPSVSWKNFEYYRQRLNELINN